MAGDRQTPSGTAFDPWPQFWVHKVASSGPLTVAGRCGFASVTTGTIFTAFTAPGRHRWPAAVPCCLRVETISAYGRPAHELDQTVSASLVLSGDVPAALTSESVLIAMAGQEPGRWRRAGSLWIWADAATPTGDACDYDMPTWSATHSDRSRNSLSCNQAGTRAPLSHADSHSMRSMAGPADARPPKPQR